MAPVVRIFYARGAYRPAWSYDNVLIPHVDVLVSILQDAAREGLDPTDYHLTQLMDRITTVRSVSDQRHESRIEALGRLDLLLTDAFLLYGSHLLNGRVSPGVENQIWGLKPDKIDLAAILQIALDRGDIASAVRNLQPMHPGYAGLRQALARYREMAASGGWPSLPPGPALRLGSYDPYVPVLRTRLQAEGYLSHDVSISDTLYDESLDQAVRSFQQQRGLEDDGVVGPATRATLNAPIDARIQQLVLNMERWRWLPRELGSRAVIVNTAGFTLDVIEAQKPVLTMRIIIGKPYTRTPLFHTRITAVELNPAWHIPPSIATKELLPLIRRDPQYLTKHHISVVRGWRDEGTINPASINWAYLSPRSFPYRLRQEPGPWNALGRIKFHLPSPFDIYLHDTPAQSLFTRAVRAFSHGCVRIEKPLDLAAYLLRDTSWARDALQTAIEQDTRTTIQLTQPVPVYIGYWTAWVEENGAVHFGPDLYGRDRRLSLTTYAASDDSRNPIRHASDCS
jgi:murein L,D-transpeptidase YcbB/YkuD